MSGLIGVGLSGLNAAQAGLLTTSNNITNQSTAGYTRQSTVQETSISLATGSGYIGQGVNVATIQRMYSQYLTTQLWSAQASSAEKDAYQTQINQLDTLLGTNSTSLATSLSSFQSAIQDWSSNPSDTASRQAVLSTARSLVSSFQTLDASMTSIREGVNQQITTSVDTINGLAAEVASLNQEIKNAEAISGGQPANDLRDQRDQVLFQLSQQIRTQTVTASDGSVSVFIGSGQSLVSGPTAASLTAVTNSEDPTSVTVALETPYGSRISLDESTLTGGALGGLLAFKTESLDSAQNALGQMAIALTSAFNNVQNSGVDLNGNLGGDLFTIGSPGVTVNSDNTGSATVTAALVSSDYRLTYSASGYTVTRLSDSADMGTFTAGSTISVDGVTITPGSGTPAVGDSFLVKPGNDTSSRVIAESDNTGTASFTSSAANSQTLTTSDYRLIYTSANTFSLTRLSDNTSWSATGATPAAALATLSSDIGLSLSVSGTPATGDSFLIQPTRNAIGGLSVALTTTAALAAGTPIKAAASTTNTGAATVSGGAVDDVSQMPLTSTMTLTYDSSSKLFTVSGASPAVGDISYDPSSQSNVAIHINGVAFTIAGVPSNGDTFTVSPSLSGANDNRNVLAFADLQSAKLLGASSGVVGSSNTATISGAYAALVSRVGSKAAEISVSATAQTALLAAAQTARDSTSAVNLDEEAANLLSYQKAYQACAKVIDIAGKLFDSILAIG